MEDTQTDEDQTINRKKKDEEKKCQTKLDTYVQLEHRREEDLFYTITFLF